ncbi:5-formyltetrahydrofolate cyclo-ligase [Stakelama saccharophila]|uniref:5-formyltetrahydrofolate cyclo-ligase n=1 Tax=Stakelama saccharophila TaxID=3075605 RepID=A0ABZ0BD46_9SPHN|nr:5-formyltetrahydrofolate cyclo-ligase [Stakelama sp. W311]WNO54991.1 5-formyltetrahydrofolate cyclo-ligase [Stakelama sp. W311]
MTKQPMDKPALRARMRAERDRFVAEHGGRIVVPDWFLALLRAGLTVASYHPIGSEADPAPLANAAVAAGATLALPHVAGKKAPMRFLAWHPDDGLADGPFGLQQPTGDRPVAPDIVLTPLVAFDGARNRLGQGAGHYDRAFAEHHDALRIGVAWQVQQVDRLRPDPWDVPLHAVITEAGSIRERN